MTTDPLRASTPARINGVALHATDEMLSPDELRQRACTELLRQAAQSAGLLDALGVGHETRIVSALRRRRDQRSGSDGH